MYGMSIKAYWANTVRSTVLLLLVVFEEISHFIHGVFKILKLRKINYPEMVRLFPVEAAAMNKKYLLLTESTNCSSFVMLKRFASIFGKI